jgi:ElaB/YqjD/DUF883 family membrane-anchored ribosome-binding protein
MSMERLASELASLRDELGSPAQDHVSAAMSASREKIDAAAEFLGEALHDIEQLVAREEENVESAIAARPLASVAVAFVAGLAIGLILRRR